MNREKCSGSPKRGIWNLGKSISILLALTWATAIAPAQTSTGTIRGTVVDGSGAAIPDATVSVINTETGRERITETNARGDFDVPLLSLGAYTVTAEFEGFQTTTYSGIRLQVDQTAVVRIEMQPGAITEVFEVQSTTPLLQSQESSIGQVIENKRIVDLPLNGRNPFALGLLAGGVTQFEGLTTNMPFAAGGGRHSGNDILLDGVDNNLRNFNGSSGRNGINYIPTVDAVQEFKVKTNNFAAEYGRSAGFTVNATIKSGTNEYHGSLFEFLRNDALDANNFISNFAGQPKQKFRQNQFGGTFGGPVRLPGYDGRNRTFFFGDFQATRIREAAGSSLQDIAPAAYRSGDFSTSTRGLYDPLSRRLNAQGVVDSDRFPNNMLPQDRMDPVALRIQDLIPLPNTGAPDATTRNFLISSPRGVDVNQGDIRVDQVISSSNNLMVRLSRSRRSQPNQGTYIFSPSERVFNTDGVAVNNVHIFTPTIVNELRLGFTYADSSSTALREEESIAFARENGLQSGQLIGFPGINFNFSGEPFGETQFSTFSASSSNLIYEYNYHLADNVSITRGNHTIKLGGEGRRFRFDRFRNFPPRGNYFFGAIFTANPTLTTETGIPYAEFLLGIPTRAVGQFQIDYARQRDAYFGAFVQDDWRIKPKLTLNLGLRYDLYTQPIDAKDRGGVFDPYSLNAFGRPGVIRIPGQDGNSRAVVQGDHNNWAPRLGFAYQWTPKFVVRAGAGVFYSQREQNDEITVIGDTLLNQLVVSTPTVIRETTVEPQLRLTDPITVESSIDKDFSTFTVASPLGADSGSNNGADIGNSRFPMLSQFNFSLQYQLSRGTVVEATYAGARGLRWVQRIDVNQISFQQALSGLRAQADRPYPYLDSAVGFDTANVNNWYHSFNLRIERQFSNGLTFLLNHTISKNTESGNAGSATYAGQGNTRAMDSFDWTRERGLSQLDIPQKFVLSALYELPWGPGKQRLSRGPLAHILGGWQINAIVSLRSGFPTDTNVAQRPPTFGLRNRPDVVAGQPTRVENPGFDQFFNPAALAVPGVTPDVDGVPIRMYGNAGRNILRGPGSNNMDLSLFKNIRITERTMIQFRAEAFNFTNTPTFSIPNARSAALRPGHRSFGKLAGSQSVGRQIQFGLKLLF